MMARSTREKITVLLAIAMLGMLAPIALAQDAKDDKFESDNKADSIKAPVSESGKDSFKVPYRISKAKLKEVEKKAIPALEVPRIASELHKDGLILGKVEEAFVPKGGARVILNFSRDHRQCFKVVIEEKDFEKFGSKSAPSIGAIYRGKQVLVSGLVTEHQNLPQILVTLPYQLEIVSPK